MSFLWILFILAGLARLAEFCINKFQSAAGAQSGIDDDVTANFDAEGNHVSK